VLEKVIGDSAQEKFQTTENIQTNGIDFEKDVKNLNDLKNHRINQVNSMESLNQKSIE
jgi:hypothetical protein